MDTFKNYESKELSQRDEDYINGECFKILINDFGKYFEREMPKRKKGKNQTP